LRGTIIGTVALVLLIAPAIFALPAAGAPDSTERIWIVGTGILCGLAPSACPDISMASNGDTIEISGEGTFQPHPKSVTGGGTFVHKDGDGAVLATGTWTATKLMSFHTFGTDAFDSTTIEGGVLKMHAVLMPSGGSGVPAILTVFCLVGPDVPAGLEEGIALNVQGPLNFKEIVSGLTVYIPTS